MTYPDLKNLLLSSFSLFTDLLYDDAIDTSMVKHIRKKHCFCPVLEIIESQATFGCPLKLC